MNTAALNRRLHQIANACKAAVYLMWDGDACLYVGVTGNVAKRLGQHRTASAWLRRVDGIECTALMPRPDAERLERATIAAHRPEFNVQSNPRYLSRQPTDGVSA